MSVDSFSFISIYWLIPVPLIFALIGLGLFHKWLGAAIFGGVSLIISLIMYDSYLTDYTDEWLSKQRLYMIIFRDFPKDKDRFVSEYVRAFESGGKEELTRKNEEMKIVTMIEYSKYYIEHTPTEVLTSYIKAEAWIISELFRKDYNLCQSYISDYKNFPAVRATVGDEIFLTSIRYNPYIITEAVYRPETPTEDDKVRAVQVYRQLVRNLRSSGVVFDAKKTVSCDTTYRQFYSLSLLPPKDAGLVIKLLYSDTKLGRTEPMTWLDNLVPF